VAWLAYCGYPAKLLMIWGYYDESGEYADGKLVNMTIGSCMAPFENWIAFEREWREALAKEGISAFHMTDFEAWVPPFDFKFTDGGRDKEKHNRILNALLDIMLRHVDGFHGFGAVAMFDPAVPALSHERLMEDCVCGAIKHAVLDAADYYGQPINLVFGKQRHFSEIMMRKYVDLYDYGDAKGCIKSFTMMDPESVCPLQAADILAYEMSKSQRDRRERYPYRRIMNGAMERENRISIQWGPIRFQYGR